MKGHPSINKTDFKDNDAVGETYPMPSTMTFEPFTQVMNCGKSGVKRQVKRRERLLATWSEAPESSIQGLGLVLEIQTVGLPVWATVVVEDWVCFATFSWRYS